ncbi:MAG: SIS domain-containing protein, partial [Sphingomicrobium sp.]
MINFGKEMVRDEARALDALAESLGPEFERACRLILDAKGKLIVSGLGKSGHIGRKIAATFASTGTTATFLHLSEAIHGDLGIADGGDVALLISQSGQTAELQPVIDHFDAIGVPIIAITGQAGSMLGNAAAAS